MGDAAVHVELHPNACKYLSAKQVLTAWNAVTKSVQRASDDEPPRWLCIGWLPDGASVEIVAMEQREGWLIIHANTPVQKKFSAEIERAERRTRCAQRELPRTGRSSPRR